MHCQDQSRVDALRLQGEQGELRPRQSVRQHLPRQGPVEESDVRGFQEQEDPDAGLALQVPHSVTRQEALPSNQRLLRQDDRDRGLQCPVSA